MDQYQYAAKRINRALNNKGFKVFATIKYFSKLLNLASASSTTSEKLYWDERNKMTYQINTEVEILEIEKVITWDGLQRTSLKIYHPKGIHVIKQEGRNQYKTYFLWPIQAIKPKSIRFEL